MSVMPKRRTVERAARFYKALLCFYPEEFRREFQQELLQTFRASCYESLRQDGSYALVNFWAAIGYDLLLSISVEHYRVWHIRMKQLFAQEKEFPMVSSSFQLNVAARSDIGCVRAQNEDYLLSVVPEDQRLLQERGALFIVADGMGGHDHGDIASHLVVEALREAYYQDTNPDLAESLKQSMYRANDALSEEVIRREKKSQMGTTCIAAVLHEKELYIANVGDSRAYLVHHDLIRQISQDHSFVAEEVRKGNITEEEARTHPRRNVIYRSFGYQEKCEVDLFRESVEEGDVLLLCTDGLTGLVSAQEMQEVIVHAQPEASVERLIALANERGGPDNTTALVVRVGVA